MLHTGISLVLLAASSGAPEDARLLDLFCPGSKFVVRVADPSALLESDDPGAWLGAFAAPEVQDKLGSFLGEVDSSAKELGADLIGILQSTRGGVLAAPADIDGVLVGALRTDDSFRPRVEALLAAAGASITEGWFAARKGSVATFPGGLTVVLMNVAGLTLLYVGPGKEGELNFRSYALRLELEGVRGGWWREIPRRVDDPFLEVFLDINAIIHGADRSPRLAQFIGAGYVGVSSCRGGSFDSRVSLRFGQNEQIRALAKGFKPCDAWFLDIAPAGAVQSHFVGLNVSTFFNAATALAAEIDPGMGAAIKRMIAQVNSDFEVDIEGELLPSLSGDVAFFRWPKVYDVFAGQAVAHKAVILGLADEMPFLAMMNYVDSLSFVRFDREDGPGPPAWKFGPRLGFEYKVIIRDDSLIVGDIRRVSAIVKWLAGTEEPGLIDADTRELAAGEDWVWVQDLGSVWATLESGAAQSLVPGSGSGAAEALFRGTVSATFDALEQRITGLAVGRIDLTPGGVSLHFTLP